MLLFFDYVILAVGPEGEGNIAVLGNEGVVDSFGSDVLNAGDPLVTRVLILRTKNKLSTTFFLCVFLSPSTCSNLYNKN